jgi:hypothetical protein
VRARRTGCRWFRPLCRRCVPSLDRQVDAHLVQSRAAPVGGGQNARREGRSDASRATHYPSRGSNHDGHRRRDHEYAPANAEGEAASVRGRSVTSEGSVITNSATDMSARRPDDPRETALINIRRAGERRPAAHSSPAHSSARSRAYRGDRLRERPPSCQHPYAQRQTPRYRTACPPVSPCLPGAIAVCPDHLTPVIIAGS